MNLPTLPQLSVDTTYVTPAGATITVAAGGDLQAALNAANPGDLISVAAGATFTGPFTLPNKPGAGWIYVQSSAYGSLPPPGTRVSPSNKAAMPKIVVSSDLSTLKTVAGSHHFRFVGIEFYPLPGTAVTRVVRVGADESSAANLPHDIVFDRCYVHGDPVLGATRGIVLDCARAGVVDSYVTDIKHTLYDATAVWVTNGTGPFKIVNNYLAGSGQSIMFGGQDSSIPNLVPADIEIRGNYLTKPLSWKVDDPAYAGTHWVIKNLLELKNARRVLVDGNILEYSWPDNPIGQDGFAVLFTVRNQSGSAPWDDVSDVTFTHNIVRHVTDGISIFGTDNAFVSQVTHRILVQNNLFYDIGAYANLPASFGPQGTWIVLSHGSPVDVTIDHNTAFQTSDPLVNYTSPGAPMNLTFTNNLTPNGPDGMGSMARLGTGLVVTKNVILDGVPANYLAGNFFLLGATPVVNAFFGGTDFSLVPGSPYAAAGTDGQAIGADIAAITLATTYTLTGIPPAPQPTSPVWTVTATGSTLSVQKNGVVVFNG